MKKPVLLLVDDDHAVLEALEAELAPVFGELCRVEAFDEPREVLEAFARWTEESRSIAVAIVDQKMPGMTGVELLSAMRNSNRDPGSERFAPARHLTGLMLTGYAGLDSAMAAKNEAGVERYLEKPWRADELRSEVSFALAHFADDSAAGQHFVFREILDASEARAALELRFEVYSRTAAAREVLPDARLGRLDVDSYDRYARLFGLFAMGGSGQTLVGTIRVAGDRRMTLAGQLEELLSADTPLGRRLREPRAHALPMLEYLVDRDAVVSLRERLVATGEQVVEPGRLALLPSHREGGADGARHLARHIIEGAVANFFSLGVANALLTCIPPHDGFYQPYGFTITEGTMIRHTPALGALVACLHGRVDRVPPAASARCTEIARRIKTGGEGACRCSNYPACLGGPYGSGDFTAVDLWCPALAARRVREERMTRASRA